MHIENLKHGDYIIIKEGNCHPNLLGVPYKVVAIQLPFVAIEYNGRVTPLNFSHFKLDKATPEYVEAFEKKQTQQMPQPMQYDSIIFGAGGM